MLAGSSVHGSSEQASISATEYCGAKGPSTFRDARARYPGSIPNWHASNTRWDCFPKVQRASRQMKKAPGSFFPGTFLTMIEPQKPRSCMR